MTDTTSTKLHFYRCRKCLATMTLPKTVSGAECGICQGRLEYLGKVTGAKWSATEQRCACDERCTSATGPNCECSCGGKNHGTGQLADVTVVTATGKVRVTPTRDIEKHQQIAAEYEAALQAAEARLTAKFGADLAYYNQRVYLPYNTWRVIDLNIAAIQKAKTTKVAALRLKKLSAICA